MSRGDDGVSATVGVVLMLVVTTVMGASVMLYTQKYTDAEFQSQPHLGLLADPDLREIEVVSADWSGGRLVWEDLQVTGCDVSHLSGDVLAAQRLLSCGDSVQIVHAPIGAVIYQHSFL